MMILCVLLFTSNSFAIELKDIPVRGTKIEQALAAEAFFQIIECMKDSNKHRQESNLSEGPNLMEQLTCISKGIGYFADNQPRPKDTSKPKTK